MNIYIECEGPNEKAASKVREQVFGREWHLSLPSLGECDPELQLTLVARDVSNHEPIAALTVLETTGNADLHGRIGLDYLNTQRAARYTQLAVLRPYRGMNLPIRLILEAQRLFVGPRQIQYTWLLFDANRAKSSSLCNLLGFGVSINTFLTEYGCSRVLIRDETSRHAALCDRQARSLLQPPKSDGLNNTIDPGANRLPIHFLIRPPVTAGQS